MGEFRMPSLGADMVEGTLTEWLVKPGARVERGDVVAVVETDKGAIEIEFFEDGVIDELRVEPWTKVPVGTVLATFHAPGESAAEVPPPEAPPAPAPAPSPSAPPPAAVSVPPPAAAATSPAVAAGPERLHASPAARRRAGELGVDLATVHGTGPDGAILYADVEGAGAPPPRRTGPDPDAMRRQIALRMARANREIPHYYLATEIDLSATLAWLAEYNRERPVAERMVYAVPLLKATALAATAYPEVNGHYTDQGFVQAPAVRLGVAIALRGGGLVVPSLDDAANRSLPELMAELTEVVERARGGRLRASDIADPTLTVTNLGDQGVPVVFPIIFPPQVAMVGFGKVVERPWVAAGAVAVRPVVTATLAADHRVSNGHRGGLFLHALDRKLQHPEAL